MTVAVIDTEPREVRFTEIRNILKAVVQSILIFGSDMWVVTPSINRVLRSFHHRVTRWKIGRQRQR